MYTRADLPDIKDVVDGLPVLFEAAVPAGSEQGKMSKRRKEMDEGMQSTKNRNRVLF